MPIREWIPYWFSWLGGILQAYVHSGLAHIRGIASAYVDIFYAWEGSVKSGIDWWLSWAPWPISIITGWFGDALKNALVSPIFTMLRSPMEFVRDEMDRRWVFDLDEYAPALWVYERFHDLGHTILTVYTFAEYYADQAAAWVSDLLSTTAAALWADLNAAWAAIQDTQLVSLPGLWDWIEWLRDTLAVARQDLDDARTDLYTILLDPPGWIWGQVSPGLTERVRSWLIAIW